MTLNCSGAAKQIGLHANFPLIRSKLAMHTRSIAPAVQ